MPRLRGLPALALAAVSAAGPSPLPAAAQEDRTLEQLRIPFTKHVLTNGLTLLVHEDHSVPIVSVNLWYHVGSRNERRGRTGFAHLFEHFFFNGSENHPHGFREAMDDLGANNRNGTTNTDRTNFFEDVPVSALERTLYLEADRMGFLAGNLSPEMLERERGVVQNEKRQGENQPYGRVPSRIAESIYPASHPYSWPTIGYTEDLLAATMEDVKEWYRTYYGPNNCVLVLAGDIGSERALELVTRYFGSIPPGPPLPRHRAWVPRFERDVRDSMEDRVPHARLHRVYHAPPWGEREAADLRLAAGVLSGSKSARLDRRLVYEKELATAVAVVPIERQIAGMFSISVTIKPGVDPAAAEAEMEAVLAEFLEEGPSPEELARARARMVSGFVKDMERLGGFGGRSDILAASMVYGGAPDAYLRIFEMVEASGPGQVLRSSRAWLDAPHYTLLVTPAPEHKPAAQTVDRKVLPALGDPPDVSFPEVQRRELPNGLKVMLLERHGAPLANLDLAVDAGFAADPAGTPGTATLTMAQMQEGTRTRDAFAIADRLDELGAQVSVSNSLDQSYVRLRGLASSLGPSLELFADIVLNPSFPEEMVQIGKRRQIARIAQEMAQPVTAALRIAPRLLYGEGHAYGIPFTGSGDEASVRGLQRKDLEAWHRSWFLPNNATLIVTGDVTMDEALPMIQASFGSWKRGTPPRKNVPVVPPGSGGKVYLVDKPDAPQSVIVAAHVSEKGGRPDDLAMETVMRLFGGMATSRLNRNLRLDKHWSYGVSAMLLDARGQRPLVLVAPVQTDKTKESMIEVARELRGIAGERPIAGEEYDSILRGTVSRLPGRFETLDSLAAAAEAMINYGRPAEYYNQYARRARALRPEDLNGAAAAHIRPAQAIWIVVGDLEAIEPGVRELGFGEVVRLGPDGAGGTKAAGR
ncbi:MAG TPA: pitrilysin family protein [Candidatus Polarisedimenticolia bacterium]|nr:pitrilysin family protein [Candidatus Polarisedimenticolia bacterium]